MDFINRYYSINQPPPPFGVLLLQEGGESYNTVNQKFPLLFKGGVAPLQRGRGG